MSSTPRASIVPWEPKLEMVLSKIPQTKGELSWFRRRERNRLTSPAKKQSEQQDDREDRLQGETDVVALKTADPFSTMDAGTTKVQLREGLIASHDHVQVDDVKKSTKFGDCDQASQLEENACKPEKKSSLPQDDNDSETPVPQPRRTIKVVAKQKKKVSEALPAAPTNPFANVSLATSGHAPPLFGGGGFESLGKAQPTLSAAKSSSMMDVGATKDQLREEIIASHDHVRVDDVKKSTKFGDRDQASQLEESACKPEKKSSLTQDGNDSETPVPRARRAIKVVAKQKKKDSESLPAAPTNPFANVSLATPGHAPPLFGGGGFESLGKVQPIRGFGSSTFGINDSHSDYKDTISGTDFGRSSLPREMSTNANAVVYDSTSSTPMHPTSPSRQPALDGASSLQQQLGRQDIVRPNGPSSEIAMHLTQDPNQCVHRDRLMAFYKVHNPAKLSDVEKLLMKYRGREEELFQRIELVYKVNLGSSDKDDDRLLKAVTIVAPDAKQVTTVVGIEDQMSDEELLQVVDGDFTDEQRENLRLRLVAFYQRHNESKVDSVGRTLEKFRGREAMLLMKLREKYITVKTEIPIPRGMGPTCFFDIEIASLPIGTVEFRLYNDKVPLAAENFRALCTGEKGIGVNSAGKPLCYRNSLFHRIVPDFCVQGGDFTKNDGTGGTSIYPPNSEDGDMWGKFKDEQFMSHTRKGLLSMANNGPNRNGSQFFVTLRATPHLDKKHVVFGEVTRGINVIDQMAQVAVDCKQRPIDGVRIADCGEIRLDGTVVRASAKVGAKGFTMPLPFSSGKLGCSWKHVASSAAKPSPFLLGTSPKQHLSASQKTGFFGGPSTSASIDLTGLVSADSLVSSQETSPATGERIIPSSFTFQKRPPSSSILSLVPSGSEHPFATAESVKTLTPQPGSLLESSPLGESKQLSCKPRDGNNENESDWVTDDGAHQPDIELEDPHRKRLVAFYEAHKPEKLQDVDKLLKKYKGREDEMYKRLFEVYNVNLESEAPHSDTSHAAPKSASEFPSDPSITAGARIDPQFDDGPKESPRGRTIEVAPEVVLANGGRERDILRRFYEKRNPSKLEEIDRILEAYEGQSDLLYQRLSLKYNVPCMENEMRNILTNSNEGGKPSDDDGAHQAEVELEDPHRKRLVAFYEAHKPEKLQDVDRLLKKYEGREDEMYKRLFEVYNMNLKCEAPFSDTSHAAPKSSAEFPSDPSITAGARIDPKSGEDPKESPVGQKTEIVPKFVEEPYSYSIDFPENSADKALDLVSAIPPPPTLALGGGGSFEKMMSPILTLEEPKERPRHVVADHEPIEASPLMNASSCERLVAMDEIKCASELMDKKSTQKFEARQDHPFETIGKTQNLGLPPESSGSEDEVNEITTHKQVEMALPESGITGSTRKATVPTLIAVPSPRGYQMYADGCGSERDRLVLFYEKYNPSKLEEIDKILEAYEGQSDLMYQRLSKKYNVPMKDDGMSGSDISLLGDTPFDFVSALDSTREATGRDDPRLQREKLVAFYEKHNPAKLSQVDQILKAYQGDDGELKKLMSSKSSPSKFSKVGVAPMDSCKSPSKVSKAGCAQIEPQLSREQQRDVMRHRLISFYKIHNPSQIESVDQLLESYSGRENLLFRKLRQNIDSNVIDTEPVLPSSIQTQVTQESQSNARMSVALHPDTPTSLKEKGLAAAYPFDVSQKDVSPSSKHGPDANATTAVEKGGTAAGIHTSFLSPVSPSPSNVFVHKVTNQAAPSCSSDESQLARQVIESGPGAGKAPMKLPPQKESKCQPTLGKPSLAIAMKPIPPSRPFVGPVEVSPSNPFATKALNGSPLPSRKTDFLDRFPISHNNPFSKTSEEACHPGTTVNVPFSSFRSVSSSGSQFLESMKASKDNPFAKPTLVASSLTKNASSFLREVKPSMNNPFAPGSAGLLSKPPMPSIGLDSHNASSRNTKDALAITENLIVTSSQLRQAAADPAFAPPPPREGSINAETSLSVLASSTAASISASFGSGFRSSAESLSKASSTPPRQALKGRSSLAAALAATPTEPGSKTKDYSFETWYSESDDDEVSHVEAPAGRVAVASHDGNSGLLVQAKTKGKR